jgi:hypothetical protein
MCKFQTQTFLFLASEKKCGTVVRPVFPGEFFCGICVILNYVIRIDFDPRVCFYV